MKHWKKAPCQLCHAKFDHRIMEAVGFFDDEMRIFTQNTFNFTEGEASVLFHDFLILFAYSDVFVNYILLNKWK